MSDCDKTSELLSAYVDRELDGDAIRRVEDHIAGCPECMRIVEAFRATDEAARHIDSPSDQAWKGVWNRIESGMSRQVARRVLFARAWRGALWAAAAALLVGALYVFIPRHEPAHWGFEVVSIEVASAEYTPVVLAANGDTLPVVLIERM